MPSHEKPNKHTVDDSTNTVTTRTSRFVESMSAGYGIDVSADSGYTGPAPGAGAAAAAGLTAGALVVAAAGLSAGRGDAAEAVGEAAPPAAGEDVTGFGNAGRAGFAAVGDAAGELPGDVEPVLTGAGF